MAAREVKMTATEKSPAARESQETPSPEVQRTMRLSTYEGAVTTVFLNWTSGAVLTGYLLYYNATPLQLALGGSVPLLAQASSPFAAWIHSRFPNPRILTSIFAGIGRAVWLLPALLPLLSLPPDSISGYILLMMVFSHFFQAAGGTVWTVWMGNVVPPRVRGRYFTTRAALLSVVGLTANISVGLFLDAVKAPLSYQVTFIVGVTLAMIGVNTYRFHYNPPIVAERLSLRATFRTPLADPNFRKLLRFVAYWQASVMLGAGFVYPYLISHLKLSFTTIAIYQAIAAITTLIVGPMWGRVADTMGNKAVLSITTLIAGALLPMTWILATPGTTTMIFISGVVDGIAWSAINPAIFNLSLATAPKQTRAAYIGVLSLLSGVMGFMGGLLSAPLKELFVYTEWTLLGFEWTSYHTLFLVSAMARSVAWVLIKPVHESRAWRTRDVLRAAMHSRFVGFFWRQ